MEHKISIPQRAFNPAGKTFSVETWVIGDNGFKNPGKRNSHGLSQGERMQENARGDNLRVALEIGDIDPFVSEKEVNMRR